jgi:HEPN domain-containing protein
MTVNDLAQLIKYWTDGQELDWKMHKSLLKSKHFGPSLFYLHLSMEKLIKAIIVKESKDHAPFNHNLVFLLGKTKLKFSEDVIDDLVKISEFNTTARYPKDIQAFYKTATRGFAIEWQKKATAIRKRLLQSLENS